MHTLFYTNFPRILAFFTRTFPRSVAVVHDNRFPILFIIIESLHILPQFLVERMLRHRVFIAEDDELHAGSRHRHVHAAEVFQEYRRQRQMCIRDRLERTREMRITSLS